MLGTRIRRIVHSISFQPEFAIEGIGPAAFRSHDVMLDDDLVLDLFTAELILSEATAIPMICDKDGSPIDQLIGRSITDVWRDGVFCCIRILDDSFYLKDANDGAYSDVISDWQPGA